MLAAKVRHRLLQRKEVLLSLATQDLKPQRNQPEKSTHFGA